MTPNKMRLGALSTWIAAMLAIAGTGFLNPPDNARASHQLAWASPNPTFERAGDDWDNADTLQKAGIDQGAADWINDTDWAPNIGTTAATNDITWDELTPGHNCSSLPAGGTFGVECTDVSGLEVVESDIVINADPNAGTPTIFTNKGVMHHEIGHAGGIEHLTANCTGGGNQNTMCPSWFWSELDEASTIETGDKIEAWHRY